MISFIEGIYLQSGQLDGFAAFVFYFLLYSSMGWLLESSYQFITRGEFLKPNFLLGPIKPMYGIAPLLLILLIQQDMHWSIVLFLCFLIPSTVEYITGFLSQKFFKIKWWDYSYLPLQLHGHICLYFSLSWIFLSLVTIKWIHPALTIIYSNIEHFWYFLYPVVLIYLFTDIIFSVRKHSKHVVLLKS